MRFVYICIAYLIAPLWIGALALRGFRDRTHWRGFSQRFGLGPTVQGSSIWVHAVSVGEVQAAVPLVEALLKRFPDDSAGADHGDAHGPRARRRPFSSSVSTCATCPSTCRARCARFFQRVQPRLAVILETEIWPNLYHRCGRLGVPLVLASARISPRSVNRLSAAGRPVPRDPVARHFHRRAEPGRRRAVPLHRRQPEAHARRRQHQVRLRLSAGHGSARP